MNFEKRADAYQTGYQRVKAAQLALGAAKKAVTAAEAALESEWQAWLHVEDEIIATAKDNA